MYPPPATTVGENGVSKSSSGAVATHASTGVESVTASRDPSGYSRPVPAVERVAAPSSAERLKVSPDGPSAVTPVPAPASSAAQHSYVVSQSDSVSSIPGSGRYGADLQIQQHAVALAPYRQQDKLGVQCFKCGTKLGKISLNARHHCRSCGEVFCGPCSSHRLTIPLPGEEYGQDVRVCDFCFEHLEHSDQNSLLRYFFILKSSDIPEASVKAEAAARGILMSLRSPMATRSDQDAAFQELIGRVGGLPIFIATLIRASNVVASQSADLEAAICTILLELISRNHLFQSSPGALSANPLLDAALGAGAVRFAMACVEQSSVALLGASLLEELVNRDQKCSIFQADTSDDIVFKLINLLVSTETPIQIKLLTCLAAALSKSTRVGTWLPELVKADTIGILHGLVLGSSADLASSAILVLVIFLSALRDRDKNSFFSLSIALTEGPLISKIVAMISSELVAINSGQYYTFREPVLIKRTLSLLEVLSANPAAHNALIAAGVVRAIADLLGFFVKISRGGSPDEISETIFMMVVHSLRTGISFLSESQNREAFAASNNLPQSAIRLALESSNDLVRTTSLELISLLCIYPLFGDLLYEVPGSFEKLSVLISRFIKENAATGSDVSLGISMLTFVLHYASVRAGVPNYVSSSTFGSIPTDAVAGDDLFLFQQVLQDSSLLSMCAKILSGILDMTSQQPSPNIESLLSNQLWCRAAMRVARYIHVLASTVHISLAPIFWPLINSLEIPKLLSNLLATAFREYRSGFTNHLELAYLSEFALAALGSLCGGAPFTPWIASLYAARAGQNAPKMLQTVQAETLVTSRELLVVAEERIKLFLYGIDPDPHRARQGLARAPVQLNTIQMQNAKSWKVYEQNLSYSMANVIDAVVYRGITGIFGIKVSVMALRLAWALMRHSVLRPPAKSADIDDSNRRNLIGFATLMEYCDPLSRLLVFQALPSLMSIIETPANDLKLLIDSACLELPNQPGIFVSAAIGFLESCSMNARSFPYITDSLSEHLSALLNPNLFLNNEYVDTLYVLQTLLCIVARLASVEDYSLRLISSDLVPTLTGLIPNIDNSLSGHNLNDIFRKVRSSPDIIRGQLLRTLSVLSTHDSCKFSLLSYDLPNTLFEYLDKKYLSNAPAIDLPPMIHRLSPTSELDASSKVCLEILGSFAAESNVDHLVLDILYVLASVDHVSIGNAFAIFPNSIKLMFAIYCCGGRFDEALSAKAFFILLRGGFAGVSPGVEYDFMEFDSALNYPWDMVEESRQIYFLFDIINCDSTGRKTSTHVTQPLFVPKGWVFDAHSLLHLHSLASCVFRRILNEYVGCYPTAIAAPVNVTLTQKMSFEDEETLSNAILELCSDYRLLDILEEIVLLSAEASRCLGDLFELKGVQFRMTSPRFLNTLFDMISSHSYLICNAGIRIAAAALVWSSDSRILVMTMISPMAKVVSQRADSAIEQSIATVEQTSTSFSYEVGGDNLVSDDEAHVMVSYRTLVSGLMVMSALHDENDDFRRSSCRDDYDPFSESVGASADVGCADNEGWMAREMDVLNNVCRGIALILKLRNRSAISKVREVENESNYNDELGQRLWFMLKSMAGYKSCVPILCSSGCIPAVIEIASSSASVLLPNSMVQDKAGVTTLANEIIFSCCVDALRVILIVLKTMDLTAVSIIAERHFLSVAIKILNISCPPKGNYGIRTNDGGFSSIYSLTCHCLSQLSSISEQLNHLLLSIDGFSESVTHALREESDALSVALESHRASSACSKIASVAFAEVIAPHEQIFISAGSVNRLGSFMHLIACWNNSICSIQVASPDTGDIAALVLGQPHQQLFEKCCLLVFKFCDALKPRFIDTAISFAFSYSRFVLKCLKSGVFAAGGTLDPNASLRCSVLVALRIIMSCSDLSSLHQVCWYHMIRKYLV